jgi:outer membrane protein
MMRHTTTTMSMAVAAGALLLGAGAVRAADLKIGVVDMQRALNECEAGKHAKDQVKAKFEKAQDQLKKQRDDLDKARDDFDKKALVLKEDQRRDMEKEFEAKSLEFKRRYEDFQRDLKRTDSELTSGIVEQLYGIVAEIGAQKGYTAIIEASSGVLLFSDKSIDLTDEVIKQHNANPNRARAKGKNAPAGGAGGGGGGDED